MTTEVLSTAQEALGRFVQAAARPPAAPFRSLEPFRFADAGILAARDAEIERLVRLVTMYRGVLLYGASGTGKSSVINAGALPRLTEDGFWPHRVRVQPRAGQELVLERIGASDSQDDAFLPSAFEGAATDGRLVLAASDFAEAVSEAARHCSIVLVFDQFEELVTLFPEGPTLTEVQAHVLDAIVRLLRDDTVRVKLLFAFREDYLASLEPLLSEQPELLRQSLRLVPPPPGYAKTIIRAPFDRFPGAYERELSPELAEEIATSLRRHGDNDELSLSELQVVCRRLWEADDPASLLRERGVEGLLEDHLNEALDAFAPALRAAAVSLLSRMVTARGTRNVIAGHDLVERVAAEDGIAPALAQEALGLLERKSGFVRAERRYDVDLYEITSEFLIPWISERREKLRRARAQRRERRRVMIMGAIAIVALVVAAVVTVLAVRAQNESDKANRQRAKAEYVGLASTAQALLPTRPDLSLLLALQAYRSPAPGLANLLARTALVSALETAFESGAVGILHGHDDAVTSVAFSPYGSMLASSGGDGTIRIWNTRTHRNYLVLRSRTRDVFDVAFSPNGRTLASTDEAGKINLWNVTARRPVARPLTMRGGTVISATFSRDGRKLAAASLDGEVAIWDLAGAATPRVTFRADSVRSIAFSPDGRTLALAGTNRLELWNARTGAKERAATAEGPHFGQLYAVTFRPDGGEVVAGGLDGRIWFWGLGGQTAVHQLGPQVQAINGIAFSPRGDRLVSGGADETVRVWDDTSRREIRQFRGHTGNVTSVAFSPDGRTIGSGSADRTIRLWNLARGRGFGDRLRRDPGWTPLAEASAVAFSRDGRLLATASLSTGVVYLWNARTGVPFGELRTHHGGLKGVAFGPNNLLVTVSYRGIVEVWNVAGRVPDRPDRTVPAAPESPALFSPNRKLLAYVDPHNTLQVMDLLTGVSRPFGHAASQKIFAIAFSNELLASGGDDRMIHVWNLSTGKQVETLSGDTDAIFSLAFSPRGDIIASGSADTTIRLWDLVKRKQLGGTLTGHHHWVRSVAFSPDGRTLASGSADGEIRLWDVGNAGATALGQPLSAHAYVEGVAFSPDGRTLASAARDGGTRLWTPIGVAEAPARLTAEVCGLVGDGLTSGEWAHYAPDLRLPDPCPVSPR